MLRKVTLLIPLTFHDGTAVPKETLTAIEEELYLVFKGWTVVGEVEGAYQMRQTGARRVERLLHVWVVLNEDAIPALKQMVGRFGAALGQEFMYFEIGESAVEFIPPIAEGSQAHED
jgi:hypothetical protein